MVMQVLMCRPDFFTVDEADPDNLYMNPSDVPDRTLSFVQHDNLVQEYRNFGLNIHFVNSTPDLPDMTFTANSAFLCPGKALLASFKPLRRRGETVLYEKFYEALGYEIFLPPKGVFFEGAGDALVYGDKILLGYGFRTTQNAVPWLEKITGKEVVPLELVKPQTGDKIFYHTDTAILAFEKKKKIILYAGAFSKESIDRLDTIGDIHSVWYRDAELLALNGLVIERSGMSLPAQKNLSHKWDGIAVLSSVANRRVQNIVEHIGYKPILAALSEFLKAGGGPFCLTKVLY